jgi:2',3'-cyclic-nucleotide 2'-phosphodiesterase (5'-nucleotidase family)
LRRPSTRGLVIGVVALAAVVTAVLLVPAVSGRPAGPFTLTILHNNDGESQLTGAPADPEFGGIARFAALVHDLQEAAVREPGHGVVTVSSGDNYLAGPQFAASLEKGPPFYDSTGLDRVGYDALALGNHEFDFGPDVLADFISGFGPGTPFLSSNLDVAPEPRLAELAAAGRIAPSTVVEEAGHRIGIVGATTPALRSISSPRDVVVGPDVLGSVQAEVDRLTSDGVDKIVLISHLQNVLEDRELVTKLRGVDVAIAGGGDELLANPETALVPEDERSVDPLSGQPYGYPIRVPDAEGREVPVVTTAGDYKYVGRLVVTFDDQGAVTGVDSASGPVRVSGVAPEAVQPDPDIERDVVDPVRAYSAKLAGTVLAQSAVALEGRRDPGVRTQETNLGNLLADALLDAGQDRAAEFEVAPPQVALQNGGGIRNNDLIPAGQVTELETFGVAPFANFVAVVPDVPRAQFKELLENAVSQIPAADGRFAQVAGFRFTYDAAGTAQVTAEDGTITAPGSRVRDVVLDDGTVLVADSAVVDGGGVSVATNDFSARGGDSWPFRDLPFTTVGVSYQQALADHLTDDLAGTLTAEAYPEAGSARITRVN